jgi:hypothetical protein
MTVNRRLRAFGDALVSYGARMQRINEVSARARAALALLERGDLTGAEDELLELWPGLRE